MLALPFSNSFSAAVVDPVDPDSVVAAVKEEGVRAFNFLILLNYDNYSPLVFSSYLFLVPR